MTHPSKRKKQRDSRRRTLREPRAEYPNGVLIVHGLGHQSRRRTVELVAGRVRDAFTDVGLAPEMTELPSSAGQPPAAGLSLDGRQQALIVEGYWADLVEQHRLKHLAGGLRRLLLLIAVFPFLLTAAVQPRAHEVARDRSSRHGSRFLALIGLEDEVEELSRLWPTLWRAMTAAGAVLVFWLSVRGLTLLQQLMIAGLALIALLLVLSWRWDIVEHIRIVCLEDETMRVIERRLQRDLDFLASRCERVWIIGHSQGGYLAHRLLGRQPPTRWPNVQRLTGLASGLRPIHLIATFNERRWAFSGWSSLLGGLCISVASIAEFESGGPLNTRGSSQFAQQLLIGIAHPWAILSGGFSFPDLRPTNWHFIPWTMAGVALIVVGALVGRTGHKAIPAIAPVPHRVAWEEVTSPSDIVGSMSIPDLPDTARTRISPSARQPVLDHLMRSYFGRVGFRWEVAQWLARGSDSENRFARLNELTTDLEDLSERTYRWRFSVLASFAVVGVALPVAVGVPLLDAASRFAPLGVATAVTVMIIAMLWWHSASRLRTRRFLRVARGEAEHQPPRVRARPLWSIIATALTGLIALCGALGIFLYARATHAIMGVPEPNQQGWIFVSSATLLMFVVVFTFSAGTLAIGNLRGVRLLLAVAIVIDLGAITALPQLGPQWNLHGSPGLAAPTMTAIGLVIALVGSRRKVVRSGSDDGAA